jgi:hypothetical protein
MSRECTNYFDSQFRHYWEEVQVRFFYTPLRKLIWRFYNHMLWNLLYDAAQQGFQICENYNYNVRVGNIKEDGD